MPPQRLPMGEGVPMGFGAWLHRARGWGDVGLGLGAGVLR